MSYHVYTTEGIILKRTPFGEANLLIHVLTEDLGLIMASARSSRVFLSKLRPALQEFTLVSISCVKGKNGWRIINASAKESFFFDYHKDNHKLISQIISVLLNMIVGESPSKEIFNIVKGGFKSLKETKNGDLANLEVLMVLRILRELGYVLVDNDTKIFFDDINDWNSNLLIRIKDNKKSIINIINKAFKESHL